MVVVKKLGLIVNPVAGIGGRVGLKGSDGPDILHQARALGAQPESPSRAIQALQAIARLKDSLAVITYPEEMGEQECLAAGLTPTVIGSIRSGHTSPDDTQAAARAMAELGVELIMFAGGDGTARNIYNAVGDRVPVLGIPAGVKIHSAVYAVTPRSAGEVAAMFLQGQLMKIREAEVMDIDEAAFREGVVAARLYGFLRVPEENRYVQSVKAGGLHVEEAQLRGIATQVVERMCADDRHFLIGPGTTTRAVMQLLGLENTLLGVDVVHQKQLVLRDAGESALLQTINGHGAVIVVTVIGGQGHILGRGNQQLSPKVIRAVGRANIMVVATQEKLASLAGRPLLVDTGDAELNEQLSGYIRVVTGYGQTVMYKLGY